MPVTVFHLSMYSCVNEHGHLLGSAFWLLCLSHGARLGACRISYCYRSNQHFQSAPVSGTLSVELDASLGNGKCQRILLKQMFYLMVAPSTVSPIKSPDPG